MADRGKRLIFCDLNEMSKTQEANATEAGILPGHFVEQSATGVARNNNASTVFGTQFAVADYNYLQAEDVDQAWTEDEAVIFRAVRTDERVNVRVAASQNITRRGTPLASAGDGTLTIAATTNADHIVAYADEIINVTTAGTLVRVRGA